VPPGARPGRASAPWALGAPGTPVPHKAHPGSALEFVAEDTVPGAMVHSAKYVIQARP